MRGKRFLAPVLLLALSGATAAELDPEELAEVACEYRAIPPTPQGDSHLGNLETGRWVQVRLPVPDGPTLYYAARLGNVVAYSGKGTSYRLILRVDAEDGPEAYRGPVILDGDAWNADNRQPIDLTAAITEAHRRQGYLDLFVTAEVEGDGWTLYRDRDARPITVLVASADEQLERRLAAVIALRERGVALLPMPVEIDLADGDLALADDARIVLAREDPEDRFAAEDLAAVLRERCGRSPAVVVDAPRPGDIALKRGELPAGGPEAYRVEVTAGGVTGTAADAAGLFYAACTIGQLAAPDGRLPLCRIADRPAFGLRGIQYDVARGQTVPVEWWERLIRTLARWKLNAIMIYGEDDYQFVAFPFLGRPGTFTPDKARRLSDYARRYHLQLIPQFEALGHASAVLGHDELKALRENGSPWVFCTSNEQTWRFLDTVFGELAEQFPDSRYLHIGADEFEFDFGKCPQCRAKVEAGGYGALYAEHLNRLRELCEKHGRTMLFWPSHGGPSPELSWMSVQYAAQLDKRCIPTEWIYHGPAAYPELEQYQQLGYQDVWAAPAVVCYSRIWPDYVTTFRGIRGFLRAGRDRGIGGVMTTTWEWMHGGLAANSMVGLAYAAECAWNPDSTAVTDFLRRFGAELFGVGDGKLVQEALVWPWPRSGTAARLYDGTYVRDLLWAQPTAVRRGFSMRQPERAAEAPTAVAALDVALARVGDLERRATRNGDVLAYARLGFGLMRHAVARQQAMDDAARRYRAVRRGEADAASELRAIAAALRAQQADAEALAAAYGRAEEEIGAAASDTVRLAGLRDAEGALAERLERLAAARAADPAAPLPEPGELGLETGRVVRLGVWEPAQFVGEEYTEVRVPVDAALLQTGEVRVEWQYTRGAHGLRIARTALRLGDREVAVDEHSGWAGAGSHDNLYRLRLEAVEAGGAYELVGRVAPHGGTDSRGEVWLIVED